MPKYWVISPFDFERPDVWKKVWKRNLHDGFISIGWGDLGDVSRLTEEQLFDRIRKQWPGQTQGSARRDCRMLRHFYHSVNVGDLIIARRGRKQIAAIGNVSGTAYYDPDKSLDALNSSGLPYPNHLNVKWQATPRDTVFETIVFGILTIYSTSESKFRSLTNPRHGERV